MDDIKSVGKHMSNFTNNFVNKATTNISTFFNNSNPFMKILSAILTIIIIYIIYTFIKKYIKYYRENIIYFKNGINGKLQKTIKNKIIMRSIDTNEFTYHFNLYVSDWDYNIYWHKPILVKTLSNVDFCPLVSLDPVKNDLSATISTVSGNQFTLSYVDFPLKKWTHVAIVLRETLFELYINGLLAETVILDSSVKYNDGDLKVFPWGGVGGYMSKLCYTNKALHSKDIYELSRRPTLDIDLLKYFRKNMFNNIDICAAEYDTPNETKLDDIDPYSLKIFGSLIDDTSIENIKSVSKDLFDRVKNKVESIVTLNSKVDKPCPSNSDAPLCPIGTLACDSNQKYCYYPDRDVMVSTYFNTNTDYCVVNNTGKKDGVKPFQIAGINVWEKTRGKDTKQCRNIK